ncbi:hypothetical protein FHS99_003293 [Sphingomonas prati]|uniref:VOC domain-containing protein n=1 Tax=Sphingomonas prati TaxID=1843237 RepID=A0A7W9F2W6_9SPHN|nr:hypothetical protein [Sphingomonas prati]
MSLNAQARSSPHPNYSHIVFAVEEADSTSLSARLNAECGIWQQDRSEGASTYFLDPDGHKLGIHVGSLQSRLQHYRENPANGVRVLDN